MKERGFIVHDVDQRSDEWRALRLGRVTGSVAGQMLATIKNGEAAGRRNLRIRLCLERLTGKPQESDFVSDAMKTGIEREADAVGAYEVLTGNLVRSVGFITHPELFMGCSPDGYVGDFDTLVSIKCRQPAAHWEFIRKGVIPSDAWAQMRHEMAMTDALEHCYVSFNPDFPEKLRCKFGVFTRDTFAVEEYLDLAKTFLAEVDLELSVLKGWAA